MRFFDSCYFRNANSEDAFRNRKSRRKHARQKSIYFFLNNVDHIIKRCGVFRARNCCVHQRELLLLYFWCIATAFFPTWKSQRANKNSARVKISRCFFREALNYWCIVLYANVVYGVCVNLLFRFVFENRAWWVSKLMRVCSPSDDFVRHLPESIMLDRPEAIK